MENLTILVLVIVIIILAIVGLIFGIYFENEKSETNKSIAEENINDENQIIDNIRQGPAMQIEADKKYAAILKTSAGNITIELNADAMPITVNNFVALARQNFYIGTIFHRIIKDFMIQGGDPSGDGTGGPGYQFDDEPFEGEYTRGTVAMANAGPNTNGSQFFIMHKDNALPKNYVIFGKVTNGMDVVDKIAAAPVEASFSGELSKPKDPVIIKSIEVIEN